MSWSLFISILTENSVAKRKYWASKFDLDFHQKFVCFDRMAHGGAVVIALTQTRQQKCQIFRTNSKINVEFFG